MKKEENCIICGKSFIPLKYNVKKGYPGIVCSLKCNGIKKRKPYKLCKICNHPIKVNSQGRKYRSSGKLQYCSRKCFGISHRHQKQLKCKVCKKIFYVVYSVAKLRVHCSQKCHTKHKKTLTDKFSANWLADDVGYHGIHTWLKKNYGKANKCENPNCIYPRKTKNRTWLKFPKQFNWAKIHDVKYERKRENYIMLCVSCHRHYDAEEQFFSKKMRLESFNKGHNNNN